MAEPASLVGYEDSEDEHETTTAANIEVEEPPAALTPEEVR